MHRSDDCPALAELEVWVEGGSSAGLVRQHVESCDACREESARISGERALMDELRAAAPQRTMAREACGGGDSIPGYKILSEIHRGGQGVVYRAVQLSAKRTVALKVLLQGAFATERQKRRFEREIDLVAGLNHPNIVTLYDSGQAPDGRHYFAMEHVDGVPLDEFSFGASGVGGEVGEVVLPPAPIKDALRLFVKICGAVSYAHQRGVIHRDLKPGNILVDTDGEPHVLDFGLARELDREATVEGGPVTVAGEFMGTLIYASPEQVSGDPSLVDMRSDVYTLGVILYRMLTGRFPYDVEGGVREVVDAVAGHEPIRPGLVRSAIDDEVETIVLKSLAKQRERRYQSAAELGRDVEHYLAGEPIDAKRDSALYVLRKSLWRFRVPVGIATLFVLLVAGFGVTMTVLWRRAALAEQTSQRRLETARRTQEYTQGILASLDPGETQGRDVTVESMLAEASRRIELELAGQPEVEAELRGTLVDTYMKLGLYEQAEPHARKALQKLRQVHGDEHADVAGGINRLARVMRHLGEYAESERLYRSALAMQRKLLGDEDPKVATILNNLAILLKHKGDLAAAEDHYRQAIDILRKRGLSKKLAPGLQGLANVLRERGAYDEAKSLLQESLNICRDQFGDQHPTVARVLQSMGNLATRKGDFAAAVKQYESALAMQRRLLDDAHPEIATTLNNLAHVLSRSGDHEAAEERCREALRIRRQVLGEDHPEVAASLNKLGWILLAKGDVAAVEQLHRQALVIQRKAFGQRSGPAAETMSSLGIALRARGSYGEAERLHRESLAIFEERLGPDHPTVAEALGNLATALSMGDKHEEAEALFRRALAIRRAKLPGGHWRTASTQIGLGTCLTRVGRYEEAERLLIEGYAGMRESLGTAHSRTLGARDALIELYESWDKPEKAAELRSRAEAGRP